LVRILIDDADFARRARLKPTVSKGLSNEDEVTQTIEQKNKAFVLEAFETLFNKRDYVAAERFWSSNYIQHSAHIPPGREGLFNMIKGLPDDFRYEGAPDGPESIPCTAAMTARAWTSTGLCRCSWSTLMTRSTISVEGLR
jgi:hypothetical protein